ncbi:hypothetical protein [Rhodocyclus tenuis]|uniref:Quinolinate synthase n=1 Tax=Rhodocyclus tenuis TaxID=1066 RepID=A0A840G1R7_RHOTE|nr:hypothetical protein [Rhodocyclus tenuis]MBB4248347.1 quinolinate synthase [Rhodocyclus tenuis]
MKTLKQQHEEYLARVKAKGAKTLTFVTPCCGKTVEDMAAHAGETWDTLATCPHCETIYWKVATDSEIVATIPDKAA